MERMTRDKINEIVSEYGYDQLLLMDGFDEAFVGITVRLNQPPLATYSYLLMMDTLMVRDKMSIEEATDYIDYNCLNAWVGEQTPLIVQDDLVAAAWDE
jgi:hypothetical protein